MTGTLVEKAARTDDDPPGRSLAQRLDALERANRVRTKRAKLKQDLKARRQDVRAVLAEPPDWLASMKVYDLLLAVPKVGRSKVNRLFTAESVSPSKTVGGLSERQRTALLGRLP